MIRPAVQTELTARQRQILDFIRRFQKKNGYPPTYHDIMDAFGLKSPNGITGHVKALRSKGFLEPIDRKRTRALMPTARATALPLLGVVAAGSLRDVFQTDDHIGIACLLGRADSVALVSDDALLSDVICRGDFVLYRGGKQVCVVRLLTN